MTVQRPLRFLCNICTGNVVAIIVIIQSILASPNHIFHRPCIVHQSNPFIAPNLLISLLACARAYAVHAYADSSQLTLRCVKSRLRPIYDGAKLPRRLLRIWGRSCSESALILCARASPALVLLVARCHLPATGSPFVTWCTKRASYSREGPLPQSESRIILASVDPPRRGPANGGVVGIDLRGSGDNARGVLVDFCYVESFVNSWRPRS